MALHAFCGRLLTGCIFLLVTIDAQTCLCGWVMESRLNLRLHGRFRRLGVAIGASLLRRLRRLLGFRSMMASLALLSRVIHVQSVSELHSTERSAFQDDNVFWFGLCEQESAHGHS